MSQTTELQKEAPEGYKQIQLGPKSLPVPTDWDIKRVGEITENLDRKREPIKSSERESGDVPYYGATGQVDSVSGHLFDEKLVLVGEDGADWSPFGGTAFIISGKSWVNNHVHVLRCADAVEEFLSNYLDYIEMRQVVSGTNRGKLNQSELNQFPAILPSLPEQRRIADILSTVDEQIQQTDEMIEKTKELKRGLMQDILVSGIDMNRDTQKVSLGPKTLEIPSTWTVSTIDELTEKVTDGTHNSPETQDSGRPYLTSKNIREWGFDLSDLKYVSEEDFLQINSRSKPQQGDVLYVKDGGNTGIAQVNTLDFEFCLLSSIALIRSNDELSAGFLQQQLSWSLFKQVMSSRMSGTGIKRLTIEKIKRSKIIHPPLDEQQNIASVLTKIDDKITEERETKQSLQDLKRGLMQDLLTGKIRVNTD